MTNWILHTLKFWPRSWRPPILLNSQAFVFGKAPCLGRKRTSPNSGGSSSEFPVSVPPPNRRGTSTFISPKLLNHPSSKMKSKPTRSFFVWMQVTKSSGQPWVDMPLHPLCAKTHPVPRSRNTKERKKQTSKRLQNGYRKTSWARLRLLTKEA